MESVNRRNSAIEVITGKELSSQEPENLDKVLATRSGLRFPKSLTFENWERAGRRIVRFADSSAWFLGDWIVYGESRYADRYRRAIDAVGLDYQTIRNYAWVARRFEIGRRRETLSFQHHAEVASKTQEEQEYWLTRAEKYRWSRNQLRQHMRGAPVGADDAPPDVANLPLRVTTERAQLWRKAAECMGTSLETWILVSLDSAAASASLSGAET